MAAEASIAGEAVATDDLLRFGGIVIAEIPWKVVTMEGKEAILERCLD